MGIQSVSLDDRFDLGKSTVLMNGTQALVRLMLMQKARDRAAGLNTAASSPAIAARRSAQSTCR
jgi:indolepyruvate ferredoxin oxidoreductase